MITYVEKGIGLHKAIEDAGYQAWSVDKNWFSSNDVEVQKIIDSYDPLHDVRDEAYKRINTQVQDYFDKVISSKYSRAEQDTFPYQRLDIEAWQKDNSSPTPTIDRIALNRGVTRDEQLDKIATKTAIFSDVIHSAIGKVQGLKDTIKASEDLDFINSVNFEP